MYELVVLAWADITFSQTIFCYKKLWPIPPDIRLRVSKADLLKSAGANQERPNTLVGSDELQQMLHTHLMQLIYVLF